MSLSRDGYLTVLFNQDITLPELESGPVRGRELTELKNLDVMRDVLDVTYVVNGESEPEERSELYLTVENWTANNLTIFVNFTNPILVSRGRMKDRLICRFKNP